MPAAKARKRTSKTELRNSTKVLTVFKVILWSGPEPDDDREPDADDDPDHDVEGGVPYLAVTAEQRARYRASDHLLPHPPVRGVFRMLRVHRAAANNRI